LKVGANDERWEEVGWDGFSKSYLDFRGFRGFCEVGLSTAASSALVAKKRVTFTPMLVTILLFLGFFAIDPTPTNEVDELTFTWLARPLSLDLTSS
jgi:hypothetical protein